MTAKWPKIWGILSFWPKKLNGVWALDTLKFSAGLMQTIIGVMINLLAKFRGGTNLAFKINKFSKKVPNVKSDIRNALKQFLVVVVSTKV